MMFMKITLGIINKPYIPVLLRRFFCRVFELFIARKLDGIIAVTPHIADRFIGYSNYVQIIYNYPSSFEFNFA